MDLLGYAPARSFTVAYLESDTNSGKVGSIKKEKKSVISCCEEVGRHFMEINILPSFLLRTVIHSNPVFSTLFLLSVYLKIACRY
jgi:hypothetical protein